MKAVVFLGDSLDRIREFPEQARRQAGLELRQVQHGFDPSDWKPMKSVGPGVREIRVRDSAGAFRVLYVAMHRRCCVRPPRLQEKDAGNCEARSGFGGA